MIKQPLDSPFDFCSDYHGLQRKYNSFLPLFYSQSLIEMDHAIEKTLRENQVDEIDESDDEVAEENERLRQIMAKYPKKEQAEERAGCISSNGTLPLEPLADIVTLPIIFDHSAKSSPNTCALGENCNLCLFPKVQAVDPPDTTTKRNFREVEFDPMDFYSTEEQTRGNGRRNRSREIASQRAASVLLLKEIRHTLQFISAYNAGINENYQLSSNEKKGSRPLEPLEVMHQDDPSKKNANRHTPTKHRLPNCHSKNDLQGHSPAHQEFNLAKLSISGIGEEFDALRKKGFLPYASPLGCSTITDLQDAILTSVEEEPEGEWDNDDVEEQKAYVRVLRTYSGKADQERIERRQHEEERELQLRALHYRNRGKKLSAEEMELSSIESRPIVFCLPSEQSLCNFGNSCLICKGDVIQCPDMRPNVIFHPSFKRMDDTFFEADLETGARRSRTKERFLQRELTVETLKQLYHRITFIKQYNNGWIVTERRRK